MRWRMLGEPTLDELLSDEIMDAVMRRAGLDARELRRRLVELAHRLGERAAADNHSGCRGATLC